MASFSTFRTAALVWLLFVVATVPVFAATWYVTPTGTGTGSGSWANASGDLQDVITNKAGFGDQIWVAQGTYTPTYDGNGVQFPAAPRTRCFILKDGVAIYGGFSGAGTELLLTDRNFRANPTILSGDFAATPGDPTDDAYHVIISVNDGAGAILDGFVIERGNADGSTFPFIEGVFTEENTGGGLYAPTGSPTIQNCIFQQNLSGNFGAGLGTRGSPIVEGCFFLNNTAVGHGGGFGSVQSSPQLINCVFAGNACGNNGGGIYCNSQGTTVSITSCTIYGNSATGSGGGFFNQSGAGILTNTLIWGNTQNFDGQVYNEDGGWGGMITASYNLIAGGYPGTANIDANPYFNNTADLNGGDNQYFTDDDGLKIGDCSPARGAATAGPVNDITGFNRALGDAIGAYANSNAASVPSAGSFLSLSPVCPAAGTTLNLNYSGGTAPVTMVYTDGTTNYTINNYISGANITPPPPAATTTYTLVSLTDAQGCAEGSPSLNFTDVTVYTPVTVSSVSVDNPTICNGGNATITLTITGGTSPYNLIYTANGSNALIIDPFFSGDGLFTAPTTTTEFEVTFLEDANGCNAGLTAGSVTQTVTVLNGAGSHIYVKANATGAQTGLTWDDAFTSLQAAFDFAASCTGLSEIWVAAGDYYPSKESDGTTDSPRDFTFVTPDGITLYGGFPNTGNPVMSDRDPINHPTVLSGDIGSPGLNTDNCYHVVRSENDASTTGINGCVIQDGYADGPGFESRGGGVFLSQTNVTISNCIIQNNYSSDAGGGVYIEGTGAPTIRNSVITSNTAGSNGGGACMTHTSPSFSNCIFSNNLTTGGGGGGAYCNGTAILFPIFTHCTFANNTATTFAGGGMYTAHATTNITNCIFWGNDGDGVDGLWDQNGNEAIITYCTLQDGFPASTGNIFTNPLFVAIADPDGADNKWFSDDDGLHLSCGSPAIDAGSATALTEDILGYNRSNGANPDFGAYEFAVAAGRAQLHVDANVSGGTSDGSSWANAYPSLANALHHIPTCYPNVSEVWVAQGTYYPAFQTDGSTTDPQQFTFRIPDGVSVYGGFAGTETARGQRNVNTNTTILSGDVDTDGTPAGNAYHVVHQVGFETYATLNGFTIQGGNATGAGIDANGGGILLESGAELEVFSCKLLDNHADAAGGGMYLNAFGLFADNEIAFNTAQDGAGLAIESIDASIINSVFEGNAATGNGGAILVSNANGAVYNTVFVSNSAGVDGGAISTASAGPAITNCTFYDNQATSDGGAMYTDGPSSAIVANTIFTANTPDDIYGTVDVHFSLVQPGNAYIGSNNNIDAAPDFVSTTTLPGADGRWRTSDDGLRLSCSSAALNSGSSSYLPYDTYDFDGDGDTEERIEFDLIYSQRVQGTTVNMGAYEDAPLTGTATRLYVNDDATGANNGTSWANAFTNLQDAFDALSCNPATEIWVAGGTYLPTKDITRTVPVNPHEATFLLPDGIALYGGFAGGETSLAARTAVVITANPTILSGDLNGDDVVSGSGSTLTLSSNGDNVYHVVTATGLAAATRLDGFTITGGNAVGGSDFLGQTLGNQSGGGLYVNGTDAHLTLENLTFTGNTATDYGGGMFAINFASPAITNCVFDRNMANNGGGMLNGTNSSPAITNCTFSNNHAGAGGGLKNVDSSSPAISGCTFSGNYATYAGGMDNSTGATPTITNGKFLNNSAGVSGGAVYNNGTSPTFRRTVFANNTAIGNDGGAIVNEGGTPLIEASVFANNTANFSSGAILQYNGADLSIVNCTFFGNTATGLMATGAAIMADAGSSFSAQNAIFWNNTTPSNSADDVSGEALVALNTGQLSSLQHCLLQEALTSPNISDDGGNQVTNPLFDNDADPDGADNIWATSDDGLMLTACSPAIDAANGGPGTDILNVVYYDYPAIIGTSAGDIGAYEATPTNALNRLYVDGGLGSGLADGSSWANAFRGATALQDALDAACTGAEIWVKAGTYKPSKDPLGGTTALSRDNTFFINKNISLYGGFAGTETALSQRTVAVVHANPAVLSGDLAGGDFGFSGNGENAHHVLLTATNNPITIDGFTIRGGNANGGGSVVVDANPAVAQNQGGGIHAHYSSPTIRNCIFTYNYAIAGGGGYANNSNANLIDCSFDTNTGGSQGGGLFTIAGAPTITNGIFVGNVGGSQGGGMYCANSGPTISNTVFTNNSTPGNGGGLYSLANIPIVSNTTFYLNSAQNGGGLYNDDAIPQLTNVILWGNTATNGNANEKQALSVGISGGGNIANSVVQDGVPALMTDDGNNSVTDPNFANPATPFPAGQLWRTSNDGLIPAGCGLQIGTAVGGFDITGSARSGPSTPGAYTATGVISAAVGVTPETNTLTAINNTGRATYRYASAVNAFSSQYGGNWLATNVLGAPDMYPSSNYTAGFQWSPSTADGQPEYLDLSFPNAAPIDFVDVYETWAPGAISQIEVFNPGTQAFVTVYTANASPAVGVSVDSRLLHIPFAQTLFNVDRIKITLNSPAVPDYQYIDAVAIGQADLAYTYAWTPAASTSAIVPTTSGNYAVNMTSGGCAGNASEDYTFGEMEVQGNGLTILDGNTSPHPSRGTSFQPGQFSQTFFVINNGGATLEVASISLTGTDAAQFSLSGFTPASSLLPGDTTTFTLNFVPTASGIFEATVTINNNDADEAAYDFVVTATSVAAEVLAFDGVDDYITAPNNAGYETGALTVEMWVKPNFTFMPGGYPLLVGNRDASNTRWSYHIRNDLAGLDFWNGSSIASWNYPFTNNQWYHIAFSTGPALTEAYVNGVSIGTQLITFGASTGLPLLIGGNPYAPAESFSGEIDEVRIWDNTICRNQIAAYPNCEVDPASANLVTYFRFNQEISNGLNTSATTVDDLSASNQDGTLANFALTGATSNWVAPGGVVAGTSCLATLLADIQVSGNDNDINSGDNTPSLTDHTEFAVGPGSRTFTVNNLGPTSLGIDYINISGANSAEFSHDGGAATIAGNGTYTFTVTYTPGSTGTHTVTVQIASTDCDEALYTFDISATNGPARHYVNDDATGLNTGTSWTDAFTSLQSALEVAGAGDSIWVAAGTYLPTKDTTGNANPTDVQMRTFRVPTGVVVVGGFAGSETAISQRSAIAANATVLSGDIGLPGSATDNAYHVVTMNTATLDGLVISGANADSSLLAWQVNAGVWCKGGSPTVTRCIIRDNHANHYGAGIGIDFGHNVTINECIFEDNISLWNGGGIIIDVQTNATVLVEHCVFAGNSAASGAGVFFYSGAATYTALVQHCTFANNTGGAVGTEFVPDVLISNCVMWGNTGTDVFPYQGTAPQVEYSLVEGGYTGTGNIDTNPFFVNAADPDGVDNLWRTADDGLSIVCGSPAENRGTGSGKDITGAAANGAKDMGAYERQPFAVAPTVLLVNQAHTGLQSGLAWGEALTDLSTALACEQVEPSVAEIWVAEGMYKPSRDFTGSPNPANNRFKTFALPIDVDLYGGFAGGETALAQRTLTVMQANPTVLSGDLDGDDSGFTNNAENSYHVLTGSWPGGTIPDSKVDGFTITGGNATILEVDGGGILFSSVNCTIENCIFEYNLAENTGGAIRDDASAITIRNSIFHHNESWYAGAVHYTQSASTIVAENNIYWANHAPNHSTVFGSSGSSLAVANATFADNTGGNIAQVEPTNTFVNCIFQNSALGTFFGNPIVTYSSVNDATLYPGTGNSNSDPLFADISDPDGADNLWRTADDGLRLLCGSPAFNTGTSTGTPPLDILAVAANGTKDMGAYEWQGFAGTPTVLYVNQSATGSQDGDTWSDAFTELTTALACEAITPSVTEIWVAGGTYKPTTGTDRSATFALKSGLALYGGFAGTESVLGDRVLATPPSTILSGDIGTAVAFDNCYHVVTASGVDQSAVLNGFVLQDGRADETGNDAKGGGLLVNGAYPLVEQCWIQGNSATDGAGVAILNPGINAAQITELKDCTITTNTATNSGGGIYAEQMMVKFTGGTSIYVNGTGASACE